MLTNGELFLCTPSPRLFTHVCGALLTLASLTQKLKKKKKKKARTKKIIKEDGTEVVVAVKFKKKKKVSKATTDGKKLNVRMEVPQYPPAQTRLTMQLRDAAVRGRGSPSLSPPPAYMQLSSEQFEKALFGPKSKQKGVAKLAKGKSVGEDILGVTGAAARGEAKKKKKKKQQILHKVPPGNLMHTIEQMEDLRESVEAGGDRSVLGTLEGMIQMMSKELGALERNKGDKKGPKKKRRGKKVGSAIAKGDMIVQDFDEEEKGEDDRDEMIDGINEKVAERLKKKWDE